jgi:RNA polymerase sigma-54 factor
VKHDEVEGLLQPKLNLKVSQRQVLTPWPGADGQRAGAEQARAEGDDQHRDGGEPGARGDRGVGGHDRGDGGTRGRPRALRGGGCGARSERVEKDPFDEIDFGSYFQDYLDPGFRTASSFEEYRPAFVRQLSFAAEHADRPSGVAAGLDEPGRRGCAGGGPGGRQSE